MAKTIPDEFIESIRERVDIVEVIGEYVVLKQLGRNYIGLCPFHTEKTPSFHVSPEKQMYYCFGCGTGGNLYTFLMQQEHLTFPEAVTYLAQRVGVALPEESEEKTRDKAKNVGKRLYILNALVAKFYHFLLTKHKLGNQARVYLRERGILDETIINFQLGYAPDSWDAVLLFTQKKGFSPKEVFDAGLTLKKSAGEGFYDRFRDRIIYPIFDLHNRILGFGARALDGSSPKYLNTPETDIFHKGRVLYGLHQAARYLRKNGQAVVMEGYMDVLVAHQEGIKETVAALGTAFTREQARLLMRNTLEAVLVFDGDEAGKTAALKTAGILEQEGCRVKIGSLPPPLDPDDYLRKNGPQVFREQILEQAVSHFNYKFNLVLQEYRVDTIEGKVKAVGLLMEDLLRIKNAVEREAYVRLIAGELGLSEEAIFRELKKSAVKLQKKGNKQDKKVNLRNNKNENKLTIVPAAPASYQAEKELLGFLLQDHSLWNRVRYELGIEAFREPAVREIMEFFLKYCENNEGEDARFPSPVELVNCVESKAAQNILAQIQVTNENLGDKERLNQLIRYLRIRLLQKEHQKIQEQLKSKEANGEEIVSLLQGLDELQKEIKMLKRNR